MTAMNKVRGHVAFRAVVGSRAYGTSLPTSDTDYKGVYMQRLEDLVSFGYVEQVNSGKDDVMYEGRRFVQLLETANPTVLELLFSPEDCIISMGPPFRVLKEARMEFLTKRCADSFGGYAVAQIRKARGLDKKMNWERDRVRRKTPLDFCYVHDAGRTVPLTEFATARGLPMESLGLAALDHFRDGYALYAGGYGGVVSPDGNEVRTVRVRQGDTPVGVLHFNRDGYSASCRDFKEYSQWERERNEQRYVDSVTHGQRIDGKNMLHCRRLLDMAKEIATEGDLVVRRPNAGYLLSIRRGDVALDRLLEDAERDVAELPALYAKSGLPDQVRAGRSNELLLEMRKENGDL